MTTFQTDAISEELVQQVKTLIGGQNRPDLMDLINRMKPADVADLVEHLETDERVFLINLLEPDGAGEVLVEIEPPVQMKILSGLDDEALSQIVEGLDSDDAADLVGDLPKERAREIIDRLADHVSEDLEKLLPYPEDTAGGIMALEFVAVDAYATVQDAIEVVRAMREKVGDFYYVWVVDEVGRLVGFLPLKDLVLESPHRKVKDIMNREVISVNALADQEEVVQLVKKYDLVSIPVVDDQHRLVGRITHDDIIDVIEEEADEDISLMAGVIDQEIAEESPLKISRARLPWLIGGLLGGLIAALVISRFESSLERILALSFFFPVIMAMGGNTGSQAATVVVRGLATGDISLVNIGKRLWLEMKVAIFNGIICGILLGVIVGIWLSDPALGGIIAVALILIIINSGFIGSAVPLTMKRLNIDPAIATGPFITTSNDIIGLLIYLGLVTLFLKVSG